MRRQQLTSPVNLALKLHAQQGRAFRSRATEILYGGAAGGGKSHLIRVAFIIWCLRIPGLQCYLFRRLFPDLKRNHLEGPTSFPVLLAPLVNAAQCRIVKDEIRFGNGSKIFLRHLQHEKDMYSYQGAEIHALAFDELTHFTETIYRYLRGRCRLGSFKLPPEFEGQFPRVISGTNPGGLGHHWVKSGFVGDKADNEYVIRAMPDEEGGMLRQYVPARLSDNPSMMLNDPTYDKRLSGLGDPMLVRAMREGDWDILPGAMFGGVWRRDQHTCAPFALPLGWRVWRGGDDGFAMPAASYWLTKDPDAGTIYVIREVYRAGMLPDEFAERVLTGDRAIEFIGGYGDRMYNEEPLSGIMDAAAFADAGHGSGGKRQPSRGKQMNDLGCNWSPCAKPPGSRVHRVQDFHRRLAVNKRDPKKRPGIIFFDTCKEAIRTIPTLPRDPKDVEDVDTNAEDHPFDAVTYGLQREAPMMKRAKVTGV